MANEKRNNLRKKILILEEEKSKIEDEAIALLEALESTSLGRTEKLVDEEGFPLPNIDHYQIRTQRNRLAILRTDRKELEKKIENNLLLLHQLPEIKDENVLNGSFEVGTTCEKVSKISVSTDERRKTKAKEMKEDLVPLALVDMVMKNSPAEEADLRVNDRILSFGSIKYILEDDKSIPKLSDIGAETSKNFEKKITVKVLRGDKEILLELVPKSWSGQGSLGCHLVPL